MSDFDYSVPHKIVDGVPVALTQEEIDELAASPSGKTLASELSVLATQYKSDMTSLQLSWLSASVSNGATEASKKTQITSDLATLKAQYLADVAATKAKYSH